MSVHNVFVYGSLLADDVVQTLLKRLPASSPAVLRDYRRYSIRGRVYPAILPAVNNQVTGKVLQELTDLELHVLDAFEDVEYRRTAVEISLLVLQELTDLELHVLDAFEDVEYRRTAVEISLLHTSEKLLANTYVWGDKDDPNLYGDWDFEEWKQLHMKDFLTMTIGFLEELELPESKTRVATYESYYQQGEDQ